MNRPPDEDLAAQAARQWEELIPGLDHSPYELGMLIEETARRLEVAVHRAIKRFREAGIKTPDDYRTLALIRRLGPTGVTATDLADLLATTKGAISHRLDRFEADGLVERIESQRDRRSNTLALTDQGMELIDRAYQVVHETHTRLFSAVDRDQRDALKQALRQTATTL